MEQNQKPGNQVQPKRWIVQVREVNYLTYIIEADNKQEAIELIEEDASGYKWADCEEWNIVDVTEEA